MQSRVKSSVTWDFSGRGNASSIDTGSLGLGKWQGAELLAMEEK